MKIGWDAKLGLIVALLLLSGCAVKKPIVRAYQFAYCDKLVEGHCQHWATPCGKLHCSQ